MFKPIKAVVAGLIRLFRKTKPDLVQIGWTYLPLHSIGIMCSDEQRKKCVQKGICAFACEPDAECFYTFYKKTFREQNKQILACRKVQIAIRVLER